MNDAQSGSGLILPPERKDHLPAQTSDGASMLNMIERASRDSSVDVGKFERLVKMGVEMEEREAKRLFSAALARVMKAARPVAANANNPQTKSKYATYDRLDKELRPFYTAEGFAPSFNTEKTDRPDIIIVLCYLSHEGGHTREYRLEMPADGKGAKGGDVMTKTHATMSGLSYGKRGLLCAMFNIPVSRDDDGNKAGNKVAFLSGDELEQFKGRVAATKMNAAEIIITLKIKSLDELPLTQFAEANALVQAREKALARKPYPDTKFNDNLPAWRELIKNGEKTHAAVIGALETKYTVSDEQKKTINEIKVSA